MRQCRKLLGRIYTYSWTWGHFVGPVYLRSILDWFYQMYFVVLMGHFKTPHPTFSSHTKTKKCEELWTQKNVKLGWALMYLFHFLLDLPVCLSQLSSPLKSQVYLKLSCYLSLRERKRQVQHKLTRQKRDKRFLQ